MYTSAAAAENFINCLRQRWRRRRLKTVWVSASGVTRGGGQVRLSLTTGLLSLTTLILKLLNF